MLHKHSSLEINENGAICKDISLFDKGFGEVNGSFLFLLPEEVLYLIEKKIFDLNFIEVFNYYKEKIKDLELRYIVFKDLRNKGYIVKSGLKYGCEFRVYDKGVKPKKGEKEEHEHALYLIKVVDAYTKIKTEDFLAKIRIANNVRKRMIFAIANSESVVYIHCKRILL